MEKLGVIYKATSLTTGKSYIGQTIKVMEERRKEHEKASDDYPFHLALRKHGKKDFVWTVLEEDVPKSKLNEREIYWIAYYKAYEEGYNATKGGDNADALEKWRKTHQDQVLEQALNGLQHAQKYNEEHREEHLSNLAKARPLALQARRRRVRCIDLDLEFDSLSAAEDWSKSSENPNGMTANHQHISKVCRGQRQTAGGYHWQYIE